MRFLLIVAATLLLSGCRSGDLAAVQGKLDAPFRVRLEQLHREGRSETLAFTGRATRPLDEAMRAELKKAGAEVQTVVGDVFTARAPSNRVPRIAALDFVAQLELAQTLEPTSR